MLGSAGWHEGLLLLLQCMTTLRRRTPTLRTPPPPHSAPQAKKAAKKQQLLQRISSGEQGTAVKEAGLLPLTQQQQQNGHGHGLAVGGGHKEAAVDSMADAVALLRAAEKLGNK